MSHLFSKIDQTLACILLLLLFYYYFLFYCAHTNFTYNLVHAILVLYSTLNMQLYIYEGESNINETFGPARAIVMEERSAVIGC